MTVIGATSNPLVGFTLPIVFYLKMDENRNGRWDEGERIVRDWDADGEVDYAPRVKLTIARYLLPSGRSIHRELDREGNLITEGGVAPDVEVEPDRLRKQ